MKELDPAGRLKMALLENAGIAAQRLHGLVERLASAASKNEPISSYMQQFKRSAPPLVSMLKPQFGMIADHLTQMIVIAGRSGSDQIRVRALREGIGQLKMQIEIAGNRVKENHAVREDLPTPEGKA